MSNYTTGTISNMSFNKSALDECIHKKRIDIPYAMEIIYELYSDVLTLLDTGSLIYGGIVRDIVAGMFPLQGDLDIITSRAGYFPLSVKMGECNRVTRCISKPSERKYGRNPLIELTREFITHDNRRIQIIKSMESVVDLINSTDMVCCGLVMTHDGEVFEIIDGAEDACKKHILTLNTSGTIIESNLLERIDKLVKRGWKSKISKTEIKKALRKKSTKRHKKTGHHLTPDKQPKSSKDKLYTRDSQEPPISSKAYGESMKYFRSYKQETKKPGWKITTSEYSIDCTKPVAEEPVTPKKAVHRQPVFTEATTNTNTSTTAITDADYDLGYVWR